MTDTDLRLFQEAYEIDLGEALTDDEARAVLGRLVLLYECVGTRHIHPIPNASGTT